MVDEVYCNESYIFFRSNKTHVTTGRDPSHLDMEQEINDPGDYTVTIGTKKPPLHCLLSTHHGFSIRRAVVSALFGYDS